MLAWLYLAGAIVTELCGTLSLKPASEGKKKMYLLVGVGYILAFTLLSFSLAHGMPLGIAYGIWSAIGVALAALFSKLLFKELLTPVMMAGIGMIMAGVLLVELGAAH